MIVNKHLFQISEQKSFDCFSCHVQNICLLRSFLSDGMNELDAFAKPLTTLKKREPLFMQDMVFNSLYIVRSGSLKQVTLTDQGERVVTGFFLPGEVVGLDAIASKRYPGNVIAMETTSVCELPFDQLDRLGMRFNKLRHRLYASLSQAIDQERLMLRLMLRRTAEARLASFFMRLSDRYRRRGFSAQRFHLPMSRGDIGDYLGLSEETVSRVLSRYQQKNLMQIKGRDVHILNLDQLVMLSELSGRRDSQSRQAVIA